LARSDTERHSGLIQDNLHRCSRLYHEEDKEQARNLLGCGSAIKTIKRRAVEDDYPQYCPFVKGKDRLEDE
jgi:hypothetical protein